MPHLRQLAVYDRLRCLRRMVTNSNFPPKHILYLLLIGTTGTASAYRRKRPNTSGSTSAFAAQRRTRRSRHAGRRSVRITAAEVAGQASKNLTKERKEASRRRIKRTRDVANVLHVTAQRTADVAMSVLERGAEGVVDRRSDASKGYASISAGKASIFYL